MHVTLTNMWLVVEKSQFPNITPEFIIESSFHIWRNNFTESKQRQRQRLQPLRIFHAWFEFLYFYEHLLWLTLCVLWAETLCIYLSVHSIQEILLAYLTSIIFVARTWGAWWSQLTGTWRIHKGEKYHKGWTGEIWDRYIIHGISLLFH